MTELIVDSFAGGGGASLGISWALGRSPDVAINHAAAAIAMHSANHADTKHFTEDVWKVSPRKVMGDQSVGLLWASPDCKHFSRAKGAKPVSKKIRSLAWVVTKWAAQTGPRVIILENVREFEDWGPLVPRWECRACDWKGTEGQAKLARRRRACPRCDSRDLQETRGEDKQPVMVPDPDRKGMTFRRFVGRFRAAGYQVEWKVLDAADYGAPTHRRRLFLIARRDGMPVVWPDATHGDPKKGDLFRKPWRTAAECIDWSIPCPSIFERKRPLAEATMRRIALGVKRYVLDNPKPFIVGAGGPERAGDPKPVDRPFGLVAGGTKQALVSAFLAKHYGGVVGHEVDRPASTITAKDHHGLVAANLIHLNHGGKQDSGVEEPMRTAMSGGNHAALVYTFLTHYFGQSTGQVLDDPLGTTISKEHFGLVTVTINGETYVIVDIGMRMLTPRELARGQGFPDSYILTGTRTSQVARIGNSVCPHMAEALVRANYPSSVRAQERAVA